MDVILSGKITVSKLEQLMKAEAIMVVTPFSISTDFNVLLPTKALSPTAKTLFSPYLAGTLTFAIESALSALKI